MAGLEESRYLIDHPSVQRIARRVPALYIYDKDQVRKDFSSKKNPIFPMITRKQDRERLERNILSIEVMIPSIDTFHDNMRYISIGAKILEKHIQVKSKRVVVSSGSRISLYESLKSDWTESSQIQANHTEFRNLRRPITARLVYMQLFIAALRYFLFLSLEPPLQDIEGIGAQVNKHYLGLLCTTAKKLGFMNNKIQKFCEFCLGRAPRDFSGAEEQTFWRGGKPSYKALKQLHQKSFLPQILYLEHLNFFENCQDVPVLFVQRDILRAFFGVWPDQSITDIIATASQKRYGSVMSNGPSKRLQTAKHQSWSELPRIAPVLQPEGAPQREDSPPMKQFGLKKASLGNRQSQSPGIKAAFRNTKKVNKLKDRAQKITPSETEQAVPKASRFTLNATELTEDIVWEPDVPDIAVRQSIPDAFEHSLQHFSLEEHLNNPTSLSNMSLNPNHCVPELGRTEKEAMGQSETSTGLKRSLYGYPLQNLATLAQTSMQRKKNT